MILTTVVGPRPHHGVRLECSIQSSPHEGIGGGRSGEEIDKDG